MQFAIRKDAIHRNRGTPSGRNYVHSIEKIKNKKINIIVKTIHSSLRSESKIWLLISIHSVSRNIGSIFTCLAVKVD